MQVNNKPTHIIPVESSELIELCHNGLVLQRLDLGYEK